MKKLFLAVAALALAPIAQAAEVNVSYSDEFIEALNEDYGTREGEYLTRLLTEDIEREFSDMSNVGTVNVVIERAKPNRPTMKQMSDTIGLSFQSFSIGGAALTGEVIGVDGTTLASLDYDWFENDIRFAQSSTTWSDANRSFGRFARKLSKASAQTS
ncbi:MAG: hypothetical protein CMK07_10595 [Ponticaulis sp.]|nr:hypothetical protein [Ponticaulis sp.]